MYLVFLIVKVKHCEDRQMFMDDLYACDAFGLPSRCSTTKKKTFIDTLSDIYC